jgi:hypothetical protein
MTGLKEFHHDDVFSFISFRHLVMTALGVLAECRPRREPLLFNAVRKPLQNDTVMNPTNDAASSCREEM